MSGEFALETPSCFGGQAQTRATQTRLAREYLDVATEFDADVRVARLHLEKMLYFTSASDDWRALQTARTFPELRRATEALVASHADDDRPLSDSWYARHRPKDHEIDAFLAAHVDATKLPSGRIRCDLTGHEMTPRLPELQTHWTGRRYRNAVKRAATRRDRDSVRDAPPSEGALEAGSF